MPAPRLLVVDDSALVRRISRRMLERHGCTVREAADGQQGLDACRAEMPDAVLLDWNMPVMDGITMMRRLADEFAAAMPRVIFCTSESEVSRITEALAAGAAEYIMKPFDEEILVGKLSQIGVL